MNIDQPHTASKRRYRMDKRSAAAEETGQRILQATVDLYMERWLEDLTLEEVATRAGVTIQTVLRRFGSKAGLVQAAGETVNREVFSQRSLAPVGDIAGAVANLMDHYEAAGDLAIRTLSRRNGTRFCTASPNRVARFTMPGSRRRLRHFLPGVPWRAGSGL